MRAGLLSYRICRSLQNTSRAFAAQAASSNAVHHSDDEASTFREQVYEFAQRVVAPHASDIDASNSFPTSVNLWKEMGDFGLHGLTAPEEYGGLAMGYRFHCIAMEVCSVIQEVGVGRHTLYIHTTGAQPCVGLCCTFLWCTQQPVHQPAGAQWQPSTARKVPPQAHCGYACWVCM